MQSSPESSTDTPGGEERHQAAVFVAGLLASLVSLSICLVGLEAHAVNTSAPSSRKSHGVARSVAGGQVAYRVTVRAVRQAGKPVSSRAVSRSPKGRVLMTRSVSWTSGQRYFPRVHVEHPTLGKLSRVRQRGTKYFVSHRSGAGETVERKTLRIPAPAVNSGGLDFFLADRRGALASGKTVKFNLAAPSRLAWYRFRARKVAERKKAGQHTLSIVIEPDSMLLRAFAGEMRFRLDMGSGDVLAYDGVVGVLNKDGDRFKCKVRFTPGTWSSPG
ncbi:MAG: hypothetical protein KC502_07345 [Myxococcales bacterium]|nr:hypothetical protein [Myxococcales bacterium]